MTKKKIVNHLYTLGDSKPVKSYCHVSYFSISLSEYPHTKENKDIA